MFDYLIAGAGFAGSVLAERLARICDKNVLLIDKRPHIGGNAYDRHDDAGILIHPYGPHIFHTNSRDVFDYLSRFTEWRQYQQLDWHRLHEIMEDGALVFDGRNALDARAVRAAGLRYAGVGRCAPEAVPA